MYENVPESQKENKPISIIITTLAAHAYNNESSVIEALDSILNNMQNFIENRDGDYWIENPVMTEENFADKWNDEQEKRTEFMSWLKQARQDILVDLSKVYGIHNIAKSMKFSFGDNIVQKSFLDLGHQTTSARDNGELYVSGLTGGLTTTAGKNSTKVGGHTFFGN